MYRIAIAALPLGLLLACQFDPSGVPSGNVDAGSSADGPPGNVDGMPGADAGPSIDGMPAPDAMPPCIDQCIDNDTQYCDGAGDIFNCPLGCLTSGGAHCAQIVPSNGATVDQLTGVNAGLQIGADEYGFVDSDTGEIFVDVTLVRPPTVNGVDAGIGFFIIDDNRAVLTVDSLTVDTNGTLVPYGTRALIILSRGDIEISGEIDISGGCSNDDPDCPGPGGGQGGYFGQPAQGCGAGGNGYGVVGMPDETGGGGGGMGQPGAKAGDGFFAEPGGTGGGIGACPDASLDPLRGGSGGGEGGLTGSNGGDGGGGGGGLQLTSLALIRFSDTGEIYAAGAGGGGAFDIYGDGGGGGGSGGAILLEAPFINVTDSVLTANGGGGGGGGETGATAGAKGTRDTTQAGGGSPTGDGSAGGIGGSLDGAPQQSGAGVDGTGGGGGGAGIIRLNVPAANLSLSGATISPAHTRGDPAVQ